MRVQLNGVKRNKESLGSIDFSVDKPMLIEEKINIHIGFDQLLEFKLALESAAMELNQYNKAQLRKKDIGINLFMFMTGRNENKKGRMSISIGKS